MRLRLRLLTLLAALSLAASSLFTAGFSLASLQTGIFSSEVPSTSASSSPFPDTAGHWAESAITEMYVKNLMKGYEDSTFRPNKPVTFLEAVVTLSKLKKNNPTQADIEDNAYLETIFQIPRWAVGHVGMALQQGLLYYSEIQKISLQMPLVRQDAAVLAVRSLGLVSEAKMKQNPVLGFEDADAISQEAAPYVSVICDRQVMKGFPDNTFQPGRPISRAEMSILLRNLAKQIPGVNNDETYGFIRSVDSRFNILNLQDFNGNLQTVNLSASHSIFFNDKPATPAELVPGTYVRVMTSKREGYTLVLAQTVVPGSEVETEAVKLVSAPAPVRQWVDGNKSTETFQAVLFQNNLYILAARGEKMTSGYSVNIVKVTSTMDGQGIHYKVLIDRADPVKGAIVMPVIEYPFALLKLERPQVPITGINVYDRQNQLISVMALPTELE